MCAKRIVIRPLTPHNHTTYLTTRSAYTISVTEWRNKFRRLMNEKDNESTNKAVDSLINFETVKYFCNEQHEAQRFERALDGTYSLERLRFTCYLLTFTRPSQKRSWRP
jgi:ABC-type transport system involved in Fe-S cluster assembly fused permease/ATPase subunit